MKRPLAQKGFTLIELLIVVALLGVLAMGLIAVIDPIEQIRRGRDTALRDLGAQFYNAEQRYYTNRGVFTAAVAALAAGTGATLDTLDADVTILVGAGELKTNYQTQVDAGTPDRGSDVTVSTAGAGTEIIVCFQPESKSFTTDAINNVFTSVGAACATPGTAACFTCIR